ncbi:hypothetical protein C5B85_08335 [Pseudoclavibacter sp. AY1F1]|uniref:hypothetical protein n=1 Tax=Pseudoclavibacter sp. AY1F1 TaxID=2080583 RepID=UPI000CE8A4D4|nr:hypothetical protein [Pseudoclavibacter sp. AY1F1]PPF44753.1 hypothetical protein C5B85_08335 [Pseudoclavibacter sp. AY1F1]
MRAGTAADASTNAPTRPAETNLETVLLLADFPQATPPMESGPSQAEARQTAEAATPGGFTMLGDAGTACESDACLL